jgi:DNA polymerase-3 subunit beta
MESINIVSKAVATRTPMPILDGILMNASDGLTLTGYDMETGIESRMEADVLAAGSVVVPARVFTEIVRRLPEDDVYIDTDDKHMVKVESGSSSFNIRGLAADDYPALPIVEHDHSLSLEQKMFKDMIQQTKFAASTDDSRPILKGINVIFENGELTLVTIDGFRLAVRKETIKGEQQEGMQFIVPARAMEDVSHVLNDSDDLVTIGPSHNYVLFDTGDVKIVSRLIQGEFLSYKSILPTGNKTSLVTDPQVLLSAIERASIVIDRDEKRFPVTLETPDEDTLVISSKTDIGMSREELNIALTGELLDIDFNPKLFVDALKEIPDEKITVSFQGSVGPCSIQPLEGDSFFYLVLPLRR